MSQSLAVNNKIYTIKKKEKKKKKEEESIRKMQNMACHRSKWDHNGKNNSNKRRHIHSKIQQNK